MKNAATGLRPRPDFCDGKRLGTTLQRNATHTIVFRPLAKQGAEYLCPKENLHCNSRRNAT